jgi:hypothetical protein
MDTVFDSDFEYNRFGLMLIAAAMGLHLAAGTLNQLALARDQSKQAAAMWATAAVAFVVWMAIGLVDDELWRTEIGYAGAAALLCALLATLTRGKLAPTHP